MKKASLDRVWQTWDLTENTENPFIPLDMFNTVHIHREATHLTWIM